MTPTAATEKKNEASVYCKPLWRSIWKTKLMSSDMDIDGMNESFCPLLRSPLTKSILLLMHSLGRSPYIGPPRSRVLRSLF